MPAAPAAAPAVLTAVLRAAGHEAMNFDASRFCVDALLEDRPLRASLSRALAQGAVVPRGSLAASLARIRLHVDALRSVDSYRSLATYAPARSAVDDACALHAAAHGASLWSPMSQVYEGDHDREDPQALLSAVDRGQEVFDLVLQDAARHIADYAPGLVALSVSSIDQLYGALRLARLAREAVPGVHVCAGGPAITRILPGIRAYPPIFGLLDSVGLRDGESLLVALASTLDAGLDPLLHVPGLWQCRNGTVVASVPATPTPPVLDALPAPDFEDLVPGKWLSPLPRVPLATTRNCYYNACTFCAIGRSNEAGFRQMSPERMLEHVRRIQARYPDAVIKEVSEALHPATLLRYAALAANEPRPAPLEACLRFDRRFRSAAAARALRAGGLRVAYFGLESGSPSQMREIRKGVSLEVASDILEAFAEAGIWCNVFVIAGLPRETERDHEATMDFIGRHRQWIHSVQVSPFALAVDSDAAKLGERYRFRIRQRPAASLLVAHQLEERGDLPSAEDAERRTMELRRLCHEGADDTLARSRRVWDAHKIFFSLLAGSPTIPG